MANWIEVDFGRYAVVLEYLSPNQRIVTQRIHTFGLDVCFRLLQFSTVEDSARMTELLALTGCKSVEAM